MTIIRLDKDRKLEYTMDSLLQLEEELGVPLFTLLSDQSKVASLKVVLRLVWAGLLAHENLEYDEVKKIFPMSRFVELLPLILQELTRSIKGVNPDILPEAKKKVMKASKNGTEKLKGVATI